MSKQHHPFETLGTKLKDLREASNQSLAEVSGAVEIDELELARIEAGFSRPAEDVLLLLISYFDMKDSDAIKLWESAGYSGDLPDELRSQDDIVGSKNVVMVLAVDMRTVYSDGFDVQATQNGLTVQFNQTTAQNKQSPVARVGMSYEQAEQVMQSLQRALLKARYDNGPLRLPPGSSN